jgi:hypothetical protein
MAPGIMPMNGLEYVALGLGVSFATALVFTAIGALLGRDGDAPTGPRGGSALGVGLGYIFGHALMSEWHANGRPAETWKALGEWTREGGAFPLSALNGYDWLPWIITAATIVGVLDGRWPVPRWARWQNRLLLIELLLWLELGPLFGGFWQPLEGAKWVVGLGVATFALWTILDIRADRLGPAMPLVLMVSAIGMSVTQRLADSVIFALLSAALAATMGGVWVVSWFNPRMNLARAAIPIYALVYAGLLFGGMFYGSLPWTSAAALAVAPIASFIDRVGPWRMERSEEGELSRGTWKTALARVAAILVPIGVAIGFAIARGHGET